jgi:hypothetical protein
MDPGGSAGLPKPRSPVTLDEILRSACEGVAGITVEVSRSLLCSDNIKDISEWKPLTWTKIDASTKSRVSKSSASAGPTRLSLHGHDYRQVGRCIGFASAPSLRMD